MRKEREKFQKKPDVYEQFMRKEKQKFEKKNRPDNIYDEGRRE
jgi:hypothetical protein